MDSQQSIRQSISRAANGNRTHDLFLTKEVLYQLSYSSVGLSARQMGKRIFCTNTADSRAKQIRPRVVLWQAIIVGQSGRRDLNPQHFAWKAKALPLSYSRLIFSQWIAFSFDS
jgi:hypothetical protein